MVPLFPVACNLSVLKNLKKLEVLRIDRTEVSSLKPIADLTEIYHLSLNHSKVEDLSSLKKLRKLSTLSFANTEVKDLVPISGCVRLTEIECDGTSVSLQEILKLLTKLLPYCTPKLGLTQVSSEVMDLNSLERASFSLTKYSQVLSLIIYKGLRSSLKQPNGHETGRRWVKFFFKKYKTNSAKATLGLKMGQRLLSLSLLASVRGAFSEVEIRDMIENFAPKSVTEKVLAYNLSFYFAWINDKNQALKFAREAIGLGFDRYRFKEGRVFQKYQNDVEFQKLVLAPLFKTNPMLDLAKWLKKLPNEIHQEIYDLDLNPGKISSSQLKEFFEDNKFSLRFRKLRDFDFLYGFKELRMLSVEECRQPDLQALTTLKSLEVLSVDRNPIKNCEPLSELTSLKEISISPEGFVESKWFEKLNRMTSLRLVSHQGFTLDSLEGFSKMTQLNCLYLYRVRPFQGSSFDLASLRGLHKMKILDLEGTPVHNLLSLQEMKELEYLRVDSFSVSEAEVQLLQASLPQSKIKAT